MNAINLILKNPFQRAGELTNSGDATNLKLDRNQKTQKHIYK